jgi:hypothetical protein
MDDDARLAGSRAGQNEQRSLDMLRRLALLGIEVLEKFNARGAPPPLARARRRGKAALPSGASRYSTVTLFARFRG